MVESLDRRPVLAALALIVLALGLAARGLERRTTWYLASDQYAFLTFADDLRAGRVFHDPTAFRLLGARVPPSLAADALFQTYIWKNRRLYSRYPPGYPALLALAGAVGGEQAMHALNPVLYLVLLGLLAALAAMALGGVSRGAAAGAAALVPWLLLLLPAETHYWGLTVVRDLPAHLLGFAAVALSWRGRFLLASLVLGYACAIRPDCLLYGLSLGALALVLRPGLGTVLGAALLFLLGAAPLFAYNTVTQGHPLAFTQGTEFREVLGAVRDGMPPIRAASAFGSPLVSGGAFQIGNIRQILPGNVAYLVRAFGAFLLPALAALAWGAWRERRLAAAFGPYAGVALFFYSCWSHADPRYLVGVAVTLVVLAAIGIALVAHALAAPVRRRGWRLLGAAAIAAVVVVAPHVLPRAPAARLEPIERAAAAAVIGGALVAGLAARHATRWAAILPALALAGVALGRVATASAARDPFQRPQVERARTALEAQVPVTALLLVSSSLGRAAENINHYAEIEAHYPGELDKLGITPDQAALTFLSFGRRAFTMARAREGNLLRGDLPELHVTEIARREGEAAYEWFVDPRRALEGGVILYEITRGAPAGPPRRAPASASLPR